MKGDKLTISDIEEWINNDEGLYSWKRSSKLPMAKFIREFRTELEKLIYKVRDTPRQKTWRDYV